MHREPDHQPADGQQLDALGARRSLAAGRRLHRVDLEIEQLPLQPLRQLGQLLRIGVGPAIHDRRQEYDTAAKRMLALATEIDSLTLALGILRRNEAIDGNPDD